MISIIAWRNIWRNRTRSLVIIASVTLGLWAGIFVTGLSFGMTEERKYQLIHEHLSHIQIHTQKFSDKKEITEFIPNATQMIQQIDEQPSVTAVSGRSLINGMLMAPQGGQGVRITGIYPDREDELTGLSSKVVEGEYFPDKKNRILVGQALADRFGLKLGTKVVLTFQDTSAELVSASFRIGGLFKTVDSKLDERVIYASIDDIAKEMKSTPLIHEVALLANETDQIETLQTELKSTYPDLKIQNWKQLSPELKYLDEMMDLYLYIIIGIILFALAFGLVNTMLMAVLERVRELGMMMAIGLTKTKIFFMVLLETVYLALTGACIGLVLGAITIWITGQTGIDLGVVQEGMEEMGMSAQLFPELNWKYYPIIAFMVIVFAVLSAIYPAIKALKLNPTEAIRKI